MCVETKCSMKNAGIGIVISAVIKDTNHDNYSN